MTDIPLNEVPREDWQAEYDEVMKDEYVSSKYNRKRRLKEKEVYIRDFFPEVKDAKSVLDLGPGPGEFMEICRAYGADVHGLDAAIVGSEMGDEYLRLSQLMTERQNLKVLYKGVLEVIQEDGKLPFEDSSVSCVNSQGSIEQIFRDYLIGAPHREHKNSGLLSWKIDNDLKEVFRQFMSEIKRILEPSGICLIYGNGAKNVQEYNNLIKYAIGECGDLEMIGSMQYRLHKFKKVK